MRVLITGATGFIGSHITRTLSQAGHEIRLLVRDPAKVERVFGAAATRHFEVVRGDMTDGNSVAAALQDRQAVIHSAAFVALGRKHAERVLRDNRRGVETVIGGAVEAGVPRVVYVSSLTALLRFDGSVISADSPVADGKSPYSRSKAQCERFVRELQARGAPIRTSYPPGVLGPDDPGLSESNHGILAFFRDATLVSDSGLQMVDVRDLATAHQQILALAETPGRHVVAGHFLPWARLADALEAVSGRRLRRWRVPASMLRASGHAGDLFKRVWDFELPLTYEAMQYMTQWPQIVATDGEAKFVYRAAEDTLRDTLHWMHQAGYLSRTQVGNLAR